jgi:hypothetical protein
MTEKKFYDTQGKLFNGYYGEAAILKFQYSESGDYHGTKYINSNNVIVYDGWKD